MIKDFETTPDDMSKQKQEWDKQDQKDSDSRQQFFAIFMIIVFMLLIMCLMFLAAKVVLTWRF